MSHKIGKVARRLTQFTEKNPREVYLSSEPIYIAPLIAGSGPGCMFYPRTLSPGCGRLAYKRFKKGLSAV